MPFVSRRQWLVSVKPLPGSTGPTLIADYWASKTGGASDATLNKVWDGGARSPAVLSGVTVIDDLTLARPFKLERDQPLLKALRPVCGTFQAVVSVQPTDEDLVALGDAEVFTGTLRRVEPPDTDASSSDPATISMVWTIASVA